MSASRNPAAPGRRAIFITGAASGIGLATARRFAEGGWFVGLADIDAAGLAAALESIGAANGSLHRLDVRDRRAWTAALDAFSGAAGGRLDVLLNNAGIARHGWIEAQGEQDVADQLDVNLKGVIFGAQAGLAHLKATPGAMLVNVASVASVAAMPKLSVYAATKFAVRGLSEALDAEFSRHGVAVACILPWFLDTPILDKAAPGSNLDFRAGLKAAHVPIYRVEDGAQAIWAAVHGKPRLHHLVGKRARQAWALARWAPGSLRKRFRKQASGG